MRPSSLRRPQKEPRGRFRISWRGGPSPCSRRISWGVRCRSCLDPPHTGVVGLRCTHSGSLPGNSSSPESGLGERHHSHPALSLLSLAGLLTYLPSAAIAQAVTSLLGISSGAQPTHRKGPALAHQTFAHCRRKPPQCLPTSSWGVLSDLCPLLTSPILHSFQACFYSISLQSCLRDCSPVSRASCPLPSAPHRT